jgi:flagellar assembly protein FliH
MVWRPVSAAAAAEAEEAVPAAPATPAVDYTAQIAAMERESEQRIRAARSAGFTEGEATGRTRAAAELKPVLERLARSIEEVGQLRARLRREAEADMLRLAMAIARRVLRREMAVDPDAMHGLVLGALEKLQTQEICRVRVHPSHAAQLRGWLQDKSVEVAADAGCEPGDVIFETERGNLDASVDSQLHEIERGLADRLRRSS